MAFAVNRRMSYTSIFQSGQSRIRWRAITEPGPSRPFRSPFQVLARRLSAADTGVRRERSEGRQVVSRDAAARLAYGRETAPADGRPLQRLCGCRVLSTPRAAPP